MPLASIASLARPISRLVAAWSLSCLVASSRDIPLKLEAFDPTSAPIHLSPEGTAEIRGPHSILATPTESLPPGPLVLEFEYFCAGGVPPFPLLPGPPFEAATARTLPAIPHSEAWSSYHADISPANQPLPSNGSKLRIDLPLPADRVIQIRAARLRPPLPQDSPKKALLLASTPAAALETYLSAQFENSIRKVSVSADQIHIEGSVRHPTATFLLADIPIETLLGTSSPQDALTPISPAADGSFALDLPRKTLRAGADYDRLTSRWQILRKKPSGEFSAASHARYPEQITPLFPNLPPAHPASKKGLGGYHHGRIDGELESLGISAITVNVMPHTLISLTPSADTSPIQWQGRTYHLREAAFLPYDATFREAAAHHIMVSAILLIANPAKSSEAIVKQLGHPDASPQGVFAMPNVTSSDGIALYGAVLNAMASRWSLPDGKFGRVHHWIIHNEVDAGWVWTNAGELPAVSYMDLYQRSMRLTDLITRQYDPHARCFISLTHHWALPGEPRWFGSRNMIDLLARFTHAEGDFPWALAFHPYPQNLFNPRTWEDDQAQLSFNSPKVTPRNLEVLDAYMHQPHLLDHGKVRPIHLSENGFNSTDYTPKSLDDQAAGMALAWKKIQSLPSIESWQYHNWIDNRGEGGLRIGLRKFPDEPGDPLGPKPIWHLYKALATPDEDAALLPYLKTIGIPSWHRITRPVSR